LKGLGFSRLNRTIGAAIRTNPGYPVAGHPPGIFLKTAPADLKSARANPAELFTLPATVALKSPPESFLVSIFRKHGQEMESE
jgi:hypothetical protein